MEDILIFNFTILKFILLQRVQGLLAATSFQGNGLPSSNPPPTLSLYERNALDMMMMTFSNFCALDVYDFFSKT